MIRAAGGKLVGQMDKAADAVSTKAAEDRVGQLVQTVGASPRHRTLGGLVRKMAIRGNAMLVGAFHFMLLVLLLPRSFNNTHKKMKIPHVKIHGGSVGV